MVCPQIDVVVSTAQFSCGARENIIHKIQGGTGTTELTQNHYSIQLF